MQASLKRCAGLTLGPKATRRFSVIVRAEGKVNTKGIRATEEKVVDILKAADLPKKAVFCRCWKSDKFPYCDGKHVAHNKETGDNLGPLVIEAAAPPHRLMVIAREIAPSRRGLGMDLPQLRPSRHETYWMDTNQDRNGDGNGTTVMDADGDGYGAIAGCVLTCTGPGAPCM